MGLQSRDADCRTMLALIWMHKVEGPSSPVPANHDPRLQRPVHRLELPQHERMLLRACIVTPCHCTACRSGNLALMAHVVSIVHIPGEKSCSVLYCKKRMGPKSNANHHLSAPGRGIL